MVSPEEVENWNISRCGANALPTPASSSWPLILYI